MTGSHYSCCSKADFFFLRVVSVKHMPKEEMWRILRPRKQTLGYSTFVVPNLFWSYVFIFFRAVYADLLGNQVPQLASMVFEHWPNLESPDGLWGCLLTKWHLQKDKSSKCFKSRGEGGIVQAFMILCFSFGSSSLALHLHPTGL